MAKMSLLQLTLKLQDLFDIGMCYGLYKICDGKQFEPMTGTDFANFINMKGSCDVIVKEREKGRVSYLIYLLAGQIQNSTMANEWKMYMLSECGISDSYYKSHYKDAEDLGASRDSKSFAKAIKLVVFG